MIALNEIIEKREEFEKIYSLMGYHFDLQKIIDLKDKFIILVRENNENRANCNKLCEQVAELVNQEKDTSELISQINNLDKTIQKNEKKTAKSMKKINQILRKLPNLPLYQNKLNIVKPTTNNAEFDKSKLIKTLENIGENTCVGSNSKNLFQTLNKVVFKAENLPFVYKLTQKKHTEFLIFAKNDALEIFNNILAEFDNSKLLIQKSLRFLKKESSFGFVAMLADKTRVELDFWGEYTARDFAIKYYDASIDMTKFVNMIHIKIK